MQTNDLNRLIGTEGDVLEALKVLQFEMIKPTKEEVIKNSQNINPIFLKKVRADVERFQILGKSRRWIKRWVKRKYNITEY